MKAPTAAPFFATLYPGMCDVARSLGYALAIHGTLARDLDLVAIPWTEEAVPAVHLKDELMRYLNAQDYRGYLCRFFERELSQAELDAMEQAGSRYDEIKDDEGAVIKPHGRRAWNLYMGAGMTVDLSVMPLRICAAPA